MSVNAAAFIREVYNRRDADGRRIPPEPQHAALRPTARHLWELLANVADDDGASWWSVESLALRMGITEANVRRARSCLLAAGVLWVTTGGGRTITNLYRVPTCPQPARYRAGFDRETRAVPRDEDPREVPKEGRRRAPVPWCDPTCATCGGIGWIPHGDEAMRVSAPCPERMAWTR